MVKNKVYREIYNGVVQEKLYSRNGIGQVNNANLRRKRDRPEYFKEMGVIEYELVEVARYTGEQFQKRPTRMVYSFSVTTAQEVFERAYICGTEEEALQKFHTDLMLYFGITSDILHGLTIDHLGGIPLGK